MMLVSRKPRASWNVLAGLIDNEPSPEGRAAMMLIASVLYLADQSDGTTSEPPLT